MNYAVIMCGGSGSRFWPKSRKNFPKQFLATVGNRTMIQLTVDRINKFIPLGNIYMVTNKSHVHNINNQLPEIDDSNILIEPLIKETAACIGYSAVKLLKQDKDAVMIVLPSDHYIQDEREFMRIIMQGLDIAIRNNCLVTMGVKPTRPETAYGYIETGKKIEGLEEVSVYKVKRFTEKPNKEKAQEFIEKGTYLWNSGMFIWKASALLEQYKVFLPDMYECLMNISEAVDTEYEAEIVEQEYAKIDGISIDYGILEKSNSVYVMETNFVWDDIGSWTALERYLDKDDNGNSKKGIVRTLDSRNNILYGDKRLIAAVGVEDLIVVETEDIILVCKKDRDQDIKQLLKSLAAEPEYEVYI
ncbi:MAG: mannose-1-phosphate guanylyltransferase [Clostridiales bacterium GWB2_37_7]|nr:MAG: mannose-1-phosphate guanylyltransferase [Clostridiales bacterium GWB2_37_7]